MLDRRSTRRFRTAETTRAGVIGVPPEKAEGTFMGPGGSACYLGYWKKFSQDAVNATSWDLLFWDY